MFVQTVRVGWHTEAGRRPANQDAILVESLPDGREFYALADGMGGHRAGEVASQRALEALADSLRSGSDLRDAVQAANSAVFEAAAAEPSWEGMGTTLVAVLRTGTNYEIANVGDSRAYRIDATGVRQITSDHSFEVEAVESGRLSAAEAARSPWRRALTRAIGTDRDLRADVFGPYEVGEAHAVLMCSDGLHGSVGPESLVQSLADTPDPGAAARALVREAYENGSADNISVAIVIFGDGPPPVVPVRAPPAENAPVPARNAAPPIHPPPILPSPIPERPRRVRRRRSRRPSRLTKLEVTVILVLLGAVLGLIAAFAMIT